MTQLFLIDEDLSPYLAIRLIRLGYSTRTVKDIKLSGAEDIEIVEWAIRNNAVIITGDLDFGELWYWHYHGKVGIVVLRMKSYALKFQYEIIDFLHNNKLFLNKKINSSLIITTTKKYRIRIH